MFFHGTAGKISYAVFRVWGSQRKLKGLPSDAGLESEQPTNSGQLTILWWAAWNWKD